MSILTNIRNYFNRKENHTLRVHGLTYVPDWQITKHKFGRVMFLNIAQLLSDIYAELTWVPRIETAKTKAWIDWATRNGQRIMLQLMYDAGYKVVGYNQTIDGDWIFYELPKDSYTVDRIDDCDIVRCNNPEQQFYVLKSPTFEQLGESDYALCKGYVKLLDATLNGATTTAERLGAYVVMTPESGDFGGILTKSDKDQIEKELDEQYGMLSRQKQVMLIQQPMKSQVISLAGVDLKMNDKARIAILAIADRLKVPANQIAIIDSNSSKSLSNGSELREGDMAKYRSFRRFIDATFYDMATELGLMVDYTLENEPRSIQGQTIENEQ